MIKGKAQTEILPHEYSDFLKSCNWVYAGCGRWIDPISKTRYFINEAFKIAMRRKDGGDLTYPGNELNIMNPV